MISKKLILLVLSLFSLSNLFAKDVWVINKDHSELMLSIPYMEVSDVTAQLKHFTGKVYFANGAKDKIQNIEEITIKIKSTSFDSNNKVRDGHVKGEDFLDTKTYPYIFFDAKKVESLGDSKFRAHGELNIKGIKNHETIDFQISKAVKDSWGHLNRFVSFTKVINRKDYGVDWSKGLGAGEVLVGDEITLTAKVQIQPINDKTPSYKHMLPNTFYIQMSEKYSRGEISYQEFKKAVYREEKQKPSKETIEEIKMIDKAVSRKKERKGKFVEENRDETLPPVENYMWWFYFAVVSLFGLTSFPFLARYYYLYKKSVYESLSQQEQEKSNIDTLPYLLFFGVFCSYVLYISALLYIMP